MKLLLTLLLFASIIDAKSFLPSDIPLPKVYVQNLDPYPCDEDCMQELLDNELIFSFLAHATSPLENEEQEESRKLYVATLNLGPTDLPMTPLPTASYKSIKIALLLPYKKIGQYAISTTNAAFAYLVAKNRPFELKSYKVESESSEDIQNALMQIEKDGFSYVIAPLTQDGVNTVIAINPPVNIYFPTINKSEVYSESVFLFFGGIDYKAQTDLLLKEAVSPLVIFSDSSATGKNLALYEEGRFKYEELNTFNPITGMMDKPKRVFNPKHKVISYAIPTETTNLKHYLDKNDKIQHASFFVNTPIVKTGMILSQLTLYDSNATNVLSTQINYDPLLLSMTQYDDRKSMIIANSITEQNNLLVESNAMLQNDIVYDWINYTTTVGVDYFYNYEMREQRTYSITLEDNQMKYPIELKRPKLYKFENYISKK